MLNKRLALPLKDDKDCNKMTMNTYHFAVIGNPIEHSLSPVIHQQFAKQCGLDITYEKICAPLNQFKETVDALRNNGLYGANVTTPFKQAAFDYADVCTERAKNAGAVNTLIFKDNQCIGDNTDGIGFIGDLIKKQITIENKNILILGAGGAARGIIPALKETLPNKLFILNRTNDKAVKLAQQFDCEIFQSDIKKIDLIINTTSADFQRTDTFDINTDLSTTDCYDLNYSDRHHTFLKWSKAQNTKSCHDGLGMLIAQAAESFYLWTGKKPKASILRTKIITERS